MDSERSLTIMHALQNATNHTQRFYCNGVRVGWQRRGRVLRYESGLDGFQLTATRDAHFNQVRGSHTHTETLTLCWS